MPQWLSNVGWWEISHQFLTRGAFELIFSKFKKDYNLRTAKNFQKFLKWIFRDHHLDSKPVSQSPRIVFFHLDLSIISSLLADSRMTLNLGEHLIWTNDADIYKQEGINLRGGKTKNRKRLGYTPACDTRDPKHNINEFAIFFFLFSLCFFPTVIQASTE